MSRLLRCECGTDVASSEHDALVALAAEHAWRMHRTRLACRASTILLRGWASLRIRRSRPSTRASMPIGLSAHCADETTTKEPR